MYSSSSRRSSGRQALALAIAFAGLAACGDLGGTPPDLSPTRTYETRGIVRTLPGSGSLGDQIFVRHEAIPDLVDSSGEEVGMIAMSMAFPLADGVDLEGIEPGDKVAFTLEVDWDESPPVEITELSELPPDTELEF